METFLLGSSNTTNTDDLVRYYHGLKPKLKYNEIVTINNKHHGKHLTARTMKRICHRLDFSRCRNIDDGTLAQVISNELRSSTSLLD